MVEEDSQFQPGASICMCTCTGVCAPPHVPTHVYTCTDTHHTHPCKWKFKKNVVVASLGLATAQKSSCVIGFICLPFAVNSLVFHRLCKLVGKESL